MFHRILSQLIPLAMTFQVVHNLDVTFVDNLVHYCENKIRRFASTEKKYAKTPAIPGVDPLLFGQIIQEHMLFVNSIDRTQRIFECISDTLNEYSEQNLKESYNYRNLVEKCASKRPTTSQCDVSYRYRTINGTCNNFFHPEWGSSFSCFRRLFPANYQGVSGLRKSFRGKNQLPSPRSLSLQIVKSRNRLSNDYNSLFVFFGQVVAHDIAEFIFTTVEGTTVLDCCTYAGTKEQHPQCTPIMHQINDPFYSKRNISCIDFARMAPCHSCSVDKRIPITQVSSFLDCSILYGQTDERAKLQRRNDGSGKLSSHYTEFGELFTPLTNQSTRCQRGAAKEIQYCFRAGDTRTNQHAIIALLQTILFREHNRIADKLKNLNPHWDGEKLYQESRRILIAEFQVIVYNEFLPVLLGRDLMSKYRLHIGSGTRYDCTIDPSISVEFNGAAFRAHSIIPSKVVSGESAEYMRDLYVNTEPLYNKKKLKFLSYLASYPAEKYDWHMPTDVTHWLYKEKYGMYGFDLAAVDIQRGRDVGLPTYPQVVEYIENRPGTITQFADLKNYLVPRCLRLLQKIYDDVRDIDLWVGQVCEQIPDTMIISPTAAEIIAEQFKRLKFGDRFYIEHDHTLTDEQRKTLLHASFAKLICDNSEVDIIQPMAFLFPSNKNIPQFCSNFHGVDFEKWRERWK